MCFETLNADTLAKCAPENHSESYLYSVEAVLLDAGLCTTEMLEFHNDIGTQPLTSQYISQKRESSVALAFQCSDIFSLYEGKFFTGSDEVQFDHQYQEELVADYINQSDGKKRI